ncbi:hypothetical protein QE450_001417 [Paenibacillus sp. SORGH_AS306]|nr:hypothetical protein [Paenibacillus sp. SORGH_AS_0306]MDR6110964.1 hypothetical protein [Paenibacillus sp. SORGH_AS_0338]
MWTQILVSAFYYFSFYEDGWTSLRQRMILSIAVKNGYFEQLLAQ